MDVLIVDDEPRLPGLLARQMQAECGIAARIAHSGEEALALLAESPADLVLTDLSMPGLDGLALLGLVRQRWPCTNVVLMTAFGEVSTAREALKRGAQDYLTKPVQLDELITLVHRTQGDGSGRQQMLGESFCGMIGRSPAITAVFEAIEAFARSDVPILILGESGTGKELVAQAVHRLSPRHQRPLIEVHAGALPESVIERELFGHERGAFTGADEARPGLCEAAHLSSIFLDEIGEMPMHLQPKLLRFLQERRFMRVGGVQSITVDTRVIAATNRDLHGAVSAGTFRQDLLFRLDVARIEVPPLRERGDDVALLISDQLQRRGRDPGDIQADALALCRSYAWPGNVRELVNVIARAHLLAGDGSIAPAHLPPELRGERRASGRWQAIEPTPPAGVGDLAEQERHAIRAALQEAGGNKAAAARMLGITRRRLYSRLRILGMGD